MKQNSNHLLRIYAFVLIFIIGFGIWFLYWSFENGFPFLEGDEKIYNGTAYEFVIGNSRLQCFEILTSKYSKRDNYVIIDGQSQFFIDSLKIMPKMLEEAQNWRINMPGSFVNSIWLEFNEDTLFEINRSKWLAERP